MKLQKISLKNAFLLAIVFIHITPLSASSDTNAIDNADKEAWNKIVVRFEEDTDQSDTTDQSDDESNYQHDESDDSYHIDLSNPLACDICGKECRDSSELKTHINFHNNTRSYKCRIAPCKARFVIKGDRTRHENSSLHQNIRRYVCDHPGCTKAFAHGPHLEEHKQTHMSSDQRTYFQCQQCEKRYTRRSFLYKHGREKHPQPD